jgi:FKBP-type peptidyl-prolyl cis-trans isomerase
MKSSIRFLAPATTLLAALLLGGCGESQQPPPAADASATAPDVAAEGALKTDKDKVSYMIGMDMARGLAQVKDDIDMEIVEQAIEDQLAGREPLLSSEQAIEIRKDFMKKRQEKRVAERKAEAETNKKEGEEFLAANKSKPGVKTTASGLQYEVITEGKGAKPKPTDRVKVNYVGTKVDGTEFDSSYKRKTPATFPVSGVIKGWSEGLQLMPVGSKYKFYIPSDLAYGERGPAKIGPDATLIFEVELLGIEDGKKPAGDRIGPGKREPAKKPAK